MITKVIPNFIRFGKGNMEGRSQECLHHCAFGYVLTSYNLHMVNTKLETKLI
jgi:hypothetical protein